ncbi:hypothetical protein BS50DRAFT_148281 [Corynespora cassiicola Philippines]|uniref:Uncharacterized protein n=1 Tax=Corynespora cassiicola Philippines TaxID=1448308 RepID=A0A2T2MZB3_CORCC|nr:hypothetical protein BS50DRAFT_148281 [Corynespora cassiicola Philippines]
MYIYPLSTKLTQYTHSSLSSPFHQLTCSTSVSRLQMLISHPALHRRNSRSPLDVILFLEVSIFKIHKDALDCSNCRSISLHSLASLYICTDWVISALKDLAQILSSGRDNLRAFYTGPRLPKDILDIYVGHLSLDSQSAESCTRSLIKYRLSRLAPMTNAIIKLADKEAGGALFQAVHAMIYDVHHRTESILGMMEL